MRGLRYWWLYFAAQNLCFAFTIINNTELDLTLNFQGTITEIRAKQRLKIDDDDIKKLRIQNVEAGSSVYRMCSFDNSEDEVFYESNRKSGSYFLVNAWKEQVPTDLSRYSSMTISMNKHPDYYNGLMITLNKKPEGHAARIVRNFFCCGQQ